MPPILAVLLSYTMGSIPAAWMAGRIYGVDLRKQGSGNLGATNVIRVLGAKVGMVVFAVDMAKGAIPVLYFPRWTVLGPSLESASGFGDPSLLLAIVCGIAAIIGHTRPLFLRFKKGGKGVATASGVFLALAPVPTLLVLVVFVVTVITSGFVSLGSLIGAVLLPILLALMVGVVSPLFWLSVLVTAFVYWTHRANIGRLQRGEEHRFGNRHAPAKRGLMVVAIGAVIVAALAIAVRFA